MGVPDSQDVLQDTADNSTDEEQALPPRARPSTSTSTMKVWRKYVVLFVVSWATLVITLSSTSLLSATPEIALEFKTTVEILNVTNAMVLLSMGFSSLIWLPLGRIFGRRIAYNSALFFLFACSIGAAVAPNLATFIAMRLLVGFTGTYFMVAGQTIIADIFEPVVRGRAVGFFMVGSVAGPAIGPCMGGIIVTFTTWRIIYWVQVGMAGLTFGLSLWLVPDIANTVQQTHTEKGQGSASPRALASFFSPWKVLKQLLVPNILLADVTCGFLAATQYGLLTSVRQVVNPRFHLTTPLVSGLFYIAPGMGFFVGSVIGGRMSDRTVKRYMDKRDGLRLPKDRLNSGLSGLFLVLPVSAMLYGWSLVKGFGGLALPIVTAFWIGVGLMGTFNALNTYTAEVVPGERSEVVCSKYVVQYIFGAASSAAIAPMINAIGVGASFSILVGLQFLGGFFVIIIAKPELFSKLLHQ